MSEREPMAVPAVVAVSVPALAVAAHGVAAGQMPGPGPILLTCGVGTLGALLVAPTRRGISRSQLIARLTVVLSVGQLAGHWVLAAGGAHVTTSSGAVEESSVPMFGAHALAAVATAALIAVAAGLFGLLSATLRVLRPRSAALIATDSVVGGGVVGAVISTVLSGGTGVRGPPAFG